MMEDPDKALVEFLEKIRESNSSLADKYSRVGDKWVDADNAARLLEETKTTVLEQRKANYIRQNPGTADNAAEREIKADPEWHKWIESMVAAKTRANRLKLALKVIDMRHSEQQSLEATKRAEMKL